MSLLIAAGVILLFSFLIAVGVAPGDDYYADNGYLLAF